MTPLAPADKLAALLVLERKARAADTAVEIGFLLVNDTATLMPYRNAILWWDGRVAAVSGLPGPVREAPFTAFAAKLAAVLVADTAPRRVTAADMPPPVAASWAQNLPAQAVWLPMKGGGLLLARDEPWTDPELRIAGLWVEAGAHALRALAPRRRPLLSARLREGGWRRWLAALPVVALLLPVPQSILGLAEVVARDPLAVRAPLAGVIEEVVVQPNAPVKAGDVLVRLDSRELRGRLDIVRQQLGGIQAEWLQAQQSGIVDSRAQTAAAVLASRIEEHRAEVAQVEEQLARVTVAAGGDGVALVADPNALKGKPVRVGERILTVADAGRVEVELWIAVSDAVVLTPGAPVTLFLNISPDRGLPARLRLVNYQASLSPAGTLAFRAVADLEGEPVRIGLRGVARIEGERVALFHYLFRRPLAGLRQLVGF